MSTKSSTPLPNRDAERDLAPGTASQPTTPKSPFWQHTIRWYLLRGTLALLVAILAGSGLVYLRYRQELRAAEERIAAGSKQVNTACGLIEYGEQGQGPSILTIHGAGGGYDQGLLIAPQLGEKFRIIAPSRFGYLNTPIPEDGSVAAQAKAYACLLDTLKVKRIAVIADSAGGPSALQFALSYPDRVSALVLVSAISTLRPIRDDASGPSSAMLTDFVYWSAVTYMPDTVLNILGIPEESLRHISAEEHQRMWVTLKTMLPMSLRMPGMDHDAVEQNLPEVTALRIQDIRVPTLVVHAKDDALVPFAQGQYSADQIPNARLLAVDYGGHFVFALDAPIAAIASFVAEQSGMS